jgi:hypothetical protein
MLRVSVVCCLIQNYISPPQIKQGMFYPKYTSQQQVCGKIYYQTSPTLDYTHSCDVQHTWLQHLVTDVE